MTAVAPTPSLAELRPWLARHLETDDVEIDQIRRHAEGWSWQTYTFRIRWADPAGETRELALALRREPEDGLLAPYDTEAQYELHAAIERETRIPVPRLRWLERDPSVLGMPFYVMDRVDGHVPVQWRPDDPKAFPTPQARTRIGHDFVDLLAELHAADWRALLPGDPSPEDPEAAARAQIDHWQAYYEDNAVRAVPLLEEAIAWLRGHVAVSGRTTVNHGDYRIGNFMIGDDGRINAVFDWELAHVGDPVEDLAWAGLRLFRGRSPLWSHLLDRDAFLARYRERAGLEVPDEVLRFWTVLCFVKASASHLRAARAFEDARSDDLRLAAMGHQVLYVLKQLRDELRTLRAAT